MKQCFARPLGIALLLAGIAGAAVTDQLVRQVRHELIMLPYYSVFDNLTFQLDGSRITLRGQVTRPTLKADAERVVKRIEHLTEVVNRIEVLPVSPNDDRIRAAVYRAIYYQPILSRYAFQSVPPIHIVVRNGDVALEGVVHTKAEKDIAGVQANGVAGVFSVVNNLAVENRE